MGDILDWPKEVVRRAVDQLEAIPGKRFPCLFGHHWTAWGDPFKHTTLFSDTGGKSTQLRQKRLCTTCNRTDYRKCKVPNTW